jgi:hypothetical protein
VALEKVFLTDQDVTSLMKVQAALVIRGFDYSQIFANNEGKTAIFGLNLSYLGMK